MKEEEIRPEALFDEYLSLAKKDGETFFSSVPFLKVPCPACGSHDCSRAFEKTGFSFVECRNCGTLYVNPRPGADAFARYYSQAPSIRFWATHFYRQTEESRRNLLIKPKARLVSDKIQQYYGTTPDESCILDIGGGYGVFCEELQDRYGKNPEVVAIEPSPELHEICRKKGIRTINKFFEDVARPDIAKEQIVAATCFELAEHIQDPRAFFSHCRSVLDQNSLLIVTTLNWHGFDLQMLREHSKSIQPPAHINFFTPRSITTLLSRCGFEICEISTPGKLDVDIVSKQLKDVPCGFFRNMLEEGDDDIKQGFQTFLQKSGFSSHMMIIARNVMR
jgi:2-polyprenyl-3-methyl-5-hydroxy-6-metoxy-1,4-benzoquinol methylase/ribosomal protein S27E